MIDLQRQAPGAHVRATIPLTEYLVNALLESLNLRLTIAPGNGVRVDYKMLSFAARITAIEPDLTIRLSTSWLNSKALGFALKVKPDWKSYVYVGSDGSIQIPCGLFPAVARYRLWWHHISRVNVRSETGRLFLDIDARVRPQ